MTLFKFVTHVAAVNFHMIGPYLSVVLPVRPRQIRIFSFPSSRGLGRPPTPKYSWPPAYITASLAARTSVLISFWPFSRQLNVPAAQPMVISDDFEFGDIQGE